MSSTSSLELSFFGSLGITLKASLRMMATHMGLTMKTTNSSDDRDATIGARVPSPLLERLDEWSSSQGCVSRSEAIRRLIVSGIERVEFSGTN